MANTHSINLVSGSNQYLSIADASQSGLDLASDFTIEIWVNFTSLVNLGVFIDKGSSGSRAYMFSYFDNGGTKEIRLWTADAGDGGNWKNTGIWSPVTINTGQWYHYAVAFDTSLGTSELWIDTVSQGSGGSGLATTLNNSTEDFNIGKRSPSATNIDAKIDEVRIWGDLRTGAEILTYWKTELIGSEPDLISYFKFNNNPNDSDATSGNDLTENNAPSYTDDIPFGEVAILRGGPTGGVAFSGGVAHF